MSILSSLYHNEIHNKPNDVHNVPDTGHSGSSSAGARQASNAGSWMGVSFTDESKMDAQLADAHAVALSDAFDRAHATPRRTQGAQNVQNPQRTQKSTDGSAVLPRHAERRMEALKEGNLRPPLYYTGQEQTPCANGVWESAHTVASKLESKEEFPQG